MANVATMGGTVLIRLVTRALFLALLGFVATSGAAWAHGATAAASGDWPQGYAATHVAHDEQGPRKIGIVSVTVAQDRVVHATQIADDCSGEAPRRHDDGCCCNVACHAALAAVIAGPAGMHEPSSHRVAALSDLLVGWPSDRTERPPKRS